MRVFTEQIGVGSAMLTGYLLDGSDELSNAAVRRAVLVLPGGLCRSVVPGIWFRS